MVLTRQAKKTRKAAEGGTDSCDESEVRTPGPDKTRDAKRSRIPKATAKEKQQEKRRKMAKLSMLPEMPVDVLYEIFSLVHPGDLLRISWTARVFNGFLTSKSSRHIWQASFDAISKSEQPPARPPGMTEMGCANLLYGQYCMNCASSRPQISAWCVLMRLCGSCVEEIAMDLDCARPDGPTWRKILDVNEVLPTFHVKYHGREAVEKVLRSDRERLCNELAAVRDGLTLGVVLKYRSFVDKRTKFSDAMLRLERAAEKAKEDARADIQRQRIERIWEKLTEEGWGREIAARKSTYEPGLMQIKGVVTARPLGERAWATLRGPVKEFMRHKLNQIRTQYFTQQCESRIAGINKIVDLFRFSLPHPHDFSPSTADVCWIPEVRKTIIGGTDAEFQHLEADLRSRMSELSASQLEERKKFFLQLLPQDSSNLEHLSLVTTLFDCTKCDHSEMCTKAALSHTCVSFSHGYKNEHKASFSNVHSETAFNDRAGIPWDSGFSEYKHSGVYSALVREVVVECGENLDTVTTQEMNRRPHRFVRFGSGGAIAVLNWSEAVEHKRHHRDVHCRLMRPDELPEYAYEPEDEGNAFGCLHCWRARKPEDRRFVHQRFSVIKDHLYSLHQVTNPTEEDYYHKDPDASMWFQYKPGNCV